MLTPPKLEGSDETYARMALRIFIGPRDLEWHNTAVRLLDHGPDYGWEMENGHQKPADIYEVAGRILGYCAGLVEWKPES